MTENNEGQTSNGNSVIKTSDAARVIVYTGNVMKQANINSFNYGKNNQEVIFLRESIFFYKFTKSS